MKTINLHPSSLLAGIGLTCLAFLAMGQTPQPINPTWSPRNPLPVVLLRDYVQIYEGTPYTVPPNKILMITALGNRNLNGNAWLYVNNRPTPEIIMYCSVPAGTSSTSSISEFPRGLTMNAGDVVAVGSSNTGAVAWGYLADA